MKWKTAPLGEIATIVSGTTPQSSNPKYWGGELVWITPTDLGQICEKYVTDSLRKITNEGLNSCNLTKIPAGSVIMSSRAPIGHLGISGCDLFTNQGCKSFVCGKELDSEFLYFNLKFRMPEIQALGSGATFIEVSKSTLEKFEISFPAIEQQRQIAARLKAQLAEVESARKAAQAQLREVVKLVAKFKEKTLKKLKNLPRISLGDLLIGIEAGKSFQTSERLANSNEMGVLKVSAVSWNEFLPLEAKAIENNYKPDERHRVKKGDLLISRANTLELVGAVVLVPEDYPMRLLSDKTLRLVVNAEKILSDYLLAVLKLPEAREHIEKNATGTSNSMRNISQKTICATPIPLMTIEEQRRMADFFKAFFQETQKTQKILKLIDNEISLLPQKILAQAFER